MKTSYKPAPRFYFPESLTTWRQHHKQTTLALPPHAVRHVQVRRMQPGQWIWLFDGTGGQWQATIVEMRRSQVLVDDLTFVEQEREPMVEVTLAIAMPANERMDWVIEKATESGVHRIVPLQTQYSVVRLEAERATKRVQHWQHVAIAACEQCGRNQIPEITLPQTLTTWLQEAPIQWQIPHHHGYVLSLNQPSVSLHLPPPPTPPLRPKVTLLVGPEGGLTTHEETTAQQAGLKPWSLGQATLRSETAALSALHWVTLSYLAQSQS